MVEVPQELHFTESPQTEHGMIEGGDLLDGDLLPGWLVYRGTVAATGKSCVGCGHGGSIKYQTTP